MNESRYSLELRIIEIISVMNNNNLEFLLKKNINLFSNGELKQLLDFLESGKIEIIYKIIKNKYKEYLDLINELKQSKINKKKNKELLNEKIEEKFELIEIEKLLN